MTKPNPVLPHDDPDGPTTAALRRRLEIAGHLPSPSRPSVRHFNCLVCGCNLGSDPHADRALGACGTCKSRPEARSLKAAPGVAGSRGFTEAEIPDPQNARVHSDSAVARHSQRAAEERSRAECHAPYGGTTPCRDHRWVGLGFRPRRPIDLCQVPPWKPGPWRLAPMIFVFSSLSI